MTSPLNLNTVQFFEAVARLGRISAAADELRVSPSAISQQIRTLEEQLGVRVFRREKRRLFLTQEGERLYQATALALGMIRDARTAVMRQREPRRLIMRASSSFAVRWLGPRLKEFVDLHSSWDLRIDPRRTSSISAKKPPTWRSATASATGRACTRSRCSAI